MKIVLIGFACCYKTSAGKLLAEKLNYKHVDIDAMVEDTARKSIADIFKQQSELEFRRLESWNLLQASYLDNVVISCGGGGPLHSAFDKLAVGSTVVWLTATPETICSRLGEIPRPLFDGKSQEDIAKHLADRTPYYTKYASCTISTDNLTSSQAADAIYSKIFANL